MYLSTVNAVLHHSEAVPNCRVLHTPVRRAFFQRTRLCDLRHMASGHDVLKSLYG